MSFNSYNTRPQLVERKVAKYLNEKLKQKDLLNQIKTQEVELQNIKPDVWYNKCLETMWNYIKENYGFFLLVTLIITLLYVRYLEVSRRKEKMKQIIELIDTQEENQEDDND